MGRAAGPRGQGAVAWADVGCGAGTGREQEVFGDAGNVWFLHLHASYTEVLTL